MRRFTISYTRAYRICIICLRARKTRERDGERVRVSARVRAAYLVTRRRFFPLGGSPRGRRVSWAGIFDLLFRVRIAVPTRLHRRSLGADFPE